MHMPSSKGQTSAARSVQMSVRFNTCVRLPRSISTRGLPPHTWLPATASQQVNGRMSERASWFANERTREWIVHSKRGERIIPIGSCHRRLPVYLPDGGEGVKSNYGEDLNCGPIMARAAAEWLSPPTPHASTRLKTPVMSPRE